MDLTITVADDARATAFAKARAAYNATNTPLSEQEFLQKMVDGQLDALVDSYLVTRIDVIDFLGRFTDTERTTIRAAAKVNAQIEDYLALLNAAPGGKVNLTSQRTTGGVAALEAAGLLAPGRGAEILAL